MSCFTALSPEQIYSVALSAGFPPATAVQMTAIALRESGGCADASNVRDPGTNGPGDPGEASYGLWQINVGPNGNYRLLSQLGVTADQLLDPAVNAAAAYSLWGGNDNNLNIAWYINRTGPPYYYAEKYQQNIPVAQAAQDNVLGAGVNVAQAGAGMANVFGSADILGGSGVLVLAAALALFLVLRK